MLMRAACAVLLFVSSTCVPSGSKTAVVAVVEKDDPDTARLVRANRRRQLASDNRRTVALRRLPRAEGYP